jgi:hypothetical protein
MNRSKAMGAAVGWKGVSLGGWEEIREVQTFQVLV